VLTRLLKNCGTRGPVFTIFFSLKKEINCRGQKVEWSGVFATPKPTDKLKKDELLLSAPYKQVF
jgi:hypothetical protein